MKGLGGRGSWSQLSPPGKSGTLPIDIAPQNDSGGDVFYVIVTGDGISDPVQVIDGSRFDLDDQVELATDRGHASDLRVLCKKVEQAHCRRALEADQQDCANHVGVDFTDIGAVASDHAIAFKVDDPFAGRAS
ncbi:hypothetical protein D3C87_1184040 [compost metagenome]